MEEVHVVTSVERKRRHTAEDKALILAEAAKLGPTATARLHSISPSLIHLWRKQAKKESPFVPVAMKVPPSPLRLCIGNDIYLELPSDVDPKAIAALLKELRSSR